MRSVPATPSERTQHFKEGCIQTFEARTLPFEARDDADDVRDVAYDGDDKLWQVGKVVVVRSVSDQVSAELGHEGQHP